MRRAAFTHGHLTQVAAIAEIVRIGEETRLVTVAALDDVQRHVAHIKSGFAGHGMSRREKVCIMLMLRRVPVYRTGLLRLVDKISSAPVSVTQLGRLI